MSLDFIFFCEIFFADCDLLANRYTNYDPKTTYVKLGKALSDQSFDFESDRKTSGHIYKLEER